MKCPRCKVETCINCKAGFHNGISCKEYQRRLKAPKCRFCGEETEGQKQSRFGTTLKAKEVCQAITCQETLSQMCKQRKPCGHQCNGYKNE